MPLKAMDTGGLAARPVPQTTPSVIEQLLAHFRSTPQVLPDNVQQGLAKITAENPDIAASNVGMMGGVAQHILPGAEAWTSPTGGISLNPALMTGKTPDEVGDTLLHELTHARQAKQRGLIGQILATISDHLPYGQRPDELAAFQAEADRRTKMGRAPIYGTPHFLDDSQESRGDIRLFNQK